jgi:hypothetical protein
MADLCRCIVEQAVPEAMRSVILADARAFLSTYPADQRNRMNLRHFERHPGAPEPMGIFGLPVTWIMHENPTRRTGNVSRSAAVERLI